MQVVEIATDFGERSKLEVEEIRLARVSITAAVSDHRVGFVGLDVFAAAQIPEFIRAKVHRAIHDRARREGLGKRAQAIHHSAHEVVGTVSREKGAWMRVLE